MKYESFSYTPTDLAEFSSGTVQDTLVYLYNKGYLKKEDYEYLANTLAVYAMPNRKGFGRKLLERFFGENENEDAFVFPIIEIDPIYEHRGKLPPGGKKPTLNVIKGTFSKDKKDES